MVKYWLLKTEPSAYAFADLVKDGSTIWDGVTNPLALKYLRSMAEGDLALIYHSGKEKSIVGVAAVGRVEIPGPSSGDAKRVTVRLRPKEQLARNITLGEIKSRREFASFDLVRNSRLSVMPVGDDLWTLLMKMSKGKL